MMKASRGYKIIELLAVTVSQGLKIIFAVVGRLDNDYENQECAFQVAQGPNKLSWDLKHTHKATT
jgi:hypothetical protein